MNARNVPWWGLLSSAVPPALLAWFGLELTTSAGQPGLAERVLGEAQVVWPFAAVMSCRHRVTLTARHPLPQSER